MAVPKGVIAIVEDDAEMREALDLLLSLEGYRTEVFSSAEECMGGVMTTDSACLLVEIQLGDLSGLELYRRLSAMGRDIPVIFMTGSHDLMLYRQALELGCVAFLHKPFPMEQLIESVTRATARTRH